MIIEPFAGPGGMSEALKAVGRTNATGIEYDADACATAQAAGHSRIHADITEVEPLDVATEDVEGIAGGPPCQGFSAAGKGKGRADRERILKAVQRIAEGQPPAAVIADLAEQAEDHRSHLVLVPLRWTLELEPEWVLLEQVPAVLPLWQAMSGVLAEDGYSTWAGYVHAEQFGVPQTRKRAVLLASRRVDVTGGPIYTHRKYRKGVDRYDGDLDLKPWVSMADALDWGMTERPSMTVTGGGTATGGAEPFGNAARKGMRRELDAGRWMQRSNYSDGASGRTAAERGRTMRNLDHPSTAITSKGFQWVYERPATTVQGDARIAAPGHKCRSVGCCPDREPESMFAGESVRVTVQEAAILQSFRPDYPWQGTKTSQYQQVGNAIPPVMAEALLRQLLA